jgi:hypothetical protein
VSLGCTMAATGSSHLDGGGGVAERERWTRGEGASFRASLSTKDGACSTRADGAMYTRAEQVVPEGARGQGTNHSSLLLRQGGRKLAKGHSHSLGPQGPAGLQGVQEACGC